MRVIVAARCEVVLATLPTHHRLADFVRYSQMHVEVISSLQCLVAVSANELQQYNITRPVSKFRHNNVQTLLKRASLWK